MAFIRSLSQAPLLALAFLVAAAPVHAASTGSKLGGGLDLLADRGALPQAAPTPGTVQRAAVPRSDRNGRVLVSVVLSGTVPAADVQAKLQGLGARVTATSSFGTGSISAYLPAASARAASALAGVKAINLAHPQRHVGAVTSEGLVPMLVDKLLKRAGEKQGLGITVGVLSDSYNTSSGLPTNAPADVTSGDLPNNVIVVDDTAAGEDEGRAMLQIIHDVAPKAKLCFATAFNGEESFAANILALANPSGACKADIIVDDVSYFDVPFAQDGLLAQAANTVNAAGVAYFSSAANSNGSSQQLIYKPLAWSKVQAAAPDLQLNTVPVGLVPVSVHNFATLAAPSVVQVLQLNGSLRTVLKWDDPTLNGKVSRDFDLLFFNASSGEFLFASSDDNVATDVPAEIQGLTGAGQVKVLIALHKQNDSDTRNSALRETVYGRGNFVTPFFVAGPSIEGQPCAKDAFAVAAVFAGNPYVPESYSSKGPCKIRMDEDGNRLTKFETRNKPEVAAPDGVSTTFFLGNVKNGFPRFFGTSAAAPHAAAVAALYWADKGKGSIADLRQALLSTAKRHYGTPELVDQIIKSADGAIRFNVDGVEVTQVSDFAVQLNSAPSGVTLKALKLDASTEKPVPGIVVPNSVVLSPSSDVKAPGLKISPDTSSATGSVTFVFTPGLALGKWFRFGMDYGSSDVQGQIPAALFGMTITAKLSNGKIITGAIQRNKLATGWDASLGYGVLDAYHAVLGAADTLAQAAADPAGAQP